MLKHVTYRSSSSLSRHSEINCRSASRPISSKDVPVSTSNLCQKTSCLSFSIKSRFVDKNDTQSPTGKCVSPDNISLNSTISATSLVGTRLSSRCPSTLSLASQQQTVPVKVYVRSLRPDFEYTTVRLSTATTASELISMLLTKFRLRHRDPNLFFLTMEVEMRSLGTPAPVRRLLVLDADARPAELQQCRPRGEARFSIGMRRGGLLRVHDSILNPGSQYKSLLVAYNTTAAEVVQLLLNCYNSNDSPLNYAVHELCKNPYKDRPLCREEKPLSVQSHWPQNNKNNFAFILRRNVVYAFTLKSRLNWRRSLDQSSTDTESELEDHNITGSSMLSSSSVSSRNSALSLLSSSSSGISSRYSFSSKSPSSSPPSSPSKASSVRVPVAAPGRSFSFSSSLLTLGNSFSPISNSGDVRVLLVEKSEPSPTCLPRSSSSPISLDSSGYCSSSSPSKIATPDTPKSYCHRRLPAVPSVDTTPSCHKVTCQQNCKSCFYI